MSTEDQVPFIARKDNLDEVVTLGARLGTGAYGVVYTGKVSGDEPEAVAVKVIPRSAIAAKDKNRVDALREIAILRNVSQRVRHEGLVRLRDAYENKYWIYIIQDLCTGGELYDHIVKLGRISESETARIMRQILSAVNALHENGIVHRDLKPENILFESAETNVLKICDFGLSRILSQDDPFPACVGTPGYVAPETIRKLPCGASCDIWACGVILYILLCGTPPFRGRDQRRMLQSIVLGNFSLRGSIWPTISDDAKDLIRRMLVVDPSKRITAAEALKHPFIVEEQSNEQLDATMKALKLFNAKRKFRAVAMACVVGVGGARIRSERAIPAAAFSPAVIERLRSKFYMVAPSGCVSRDQFEAVLASLGIDTLPARSMFDAIDYNGDNHVDYKEFLCGLAALQGKGEHALKLCFAIYDTDGNGQISLDELKSVLQAFSGTSMTQQLGKAERLEEVFAVMDTDGSGDISFEEFKAALSRDPGLLDALTDPLHSAFHREQSYQHIAAMTAAAASPSAQAASGISGVTAEQLSRAGSSEGGSDGIHSFRLRSGDGISVASGPECGEESTLIGSQSSPPSAKRQKQ